MGMDLRKKSVFIITPPPTGQYHFEVDRGALRWFHRNELNQNVFNVSSPLMIPAHVWTHCAATYSSISGKAAVYVNGKLGDHVSALFFYKKPLYKKPLPFAEKLLEI